MGTNYFAERLKYRPKEEIRRKVEEFDRLIAREIDLINRKGDPDSCKAIVVAAEGRKRRYEIERDFYSRRLPKKILEPI